MDEQQGAAGRRTVRWSGETRYVELETDSAEAQLLFAFGMTAGMPYKISDNGEVLLLAPADWESRLLARLTAKVDQTPGVTEAA